MFGVWVGSWRAASRLLCGGTWGEEGVAVALAPVGAIDMGFVVVLLLHVVLRVVFVDTLDSVIAQYVQKED